MSLPLRVLLLGVVLAAAIGAMFWRRQSAEAAPEPWRLSYVTTAAQLGVVGYRDPVGAISLDGRRVAFSEGRRVFEMPVNGGARLEVGAAQGQVRHLAPDGRGGWIIEDTAAPIRWWRASPETPLSPLFGDRQEIEAD